MPVFKKRSVLTGISVREAMRKNICRQPDTVSLKTCIRQMNRSREDAILLDGPGNDSTGVITKTDIIGAYYTGFALETAAGELMNKVVTCTPDDQIDQVLFQMEAQGIHRIFVSPGTEEIVGVVSFTDVVGLLYRYCRACVKSRRQALKIEDQGLPRVRIQEVMTDHVYSCLTGDSISDAVELLLAAGTAAVLVVDDRTLPCGVVSKTDINRAYFHGRPIDDPVETVMTHPVISCSPEDLLVDALQKMFLFDLLRLFVLDNSNQPVRGVLSLSDAARFRSGTCQACSAAKVLV